MLLQAGARQPVLAPLPEEHPDLLRPCKVLDREFVLAGPHPALHKRARARKCRRGAGRTRRRCLRCAILLNWTGLTGAQSGGFKQLLCDRLVSRPVRRRADGELRRDVRDLRGRKRQEGDADLVPEARRRPLVGRFAWGGTCVVRRETRTDRRLQLGNSQVTSVSWKFPTQSDSARRDCRRWARRASAASFGRSLLTHDSLKTSSQRSVGTRASRRSISSFVAASVPPTQRVVSVGDAESGARLRGSRKGGCNP